MTENFQSKSATTLYIYTNMYTALKKTYYSVTRSFWFNNQTILLISFEFYLYLLTFFDLLLTPSDT